jgi:hypothetical protein
MAVYYEACAAGFSRYFRHQGKIKDTYRICTKQDETVPTGPGIPFFIRGTNIRLTM